MYAVIFFSYCFINQQSKTCTYQLLTRQRGRNQSDPFCTRNKPIKINNKQFPTREARREKRKKGTGEKVTRNRDDNH